MKGVSNMTNPEALKVLYEALGGEAETVADKTKTVDVLNDIAALLDGDDDAKLNSEAIYNIAQVATGGGDFTTAQVTVTNGSGGDVDFHIVQLSDVDGSLQSVGLIENNATKNFEIVIKNGVATGGYFKDTNDTTVLTNTMQLTGGVSAQGSWYVNVSGAGTITLTDGK